MVLNASVTLSPFLSFKGFIHPFLLNTSITISRYLYVFFHLLNCFISTRSAPLKRFYRNTIFSTRFTVTRRRVKSLFIDLCNSSASFSCQFFFTRLLFQFFETPKPSFCFLSIKANPWPQCRSSEDTLFKAFTIFLSVLFLHFLSSCMIIACVLPVGGWRISRVINFENFTCYGIVFYLWVWIVIGPYITMSRLCPTRFRFGSFPIALWISRAPPNEPIFGSFRVTLF